MDLESPHWDEWETQFNQLADQAQVAENKSELASAKMHLILFGNNGLTEEEELAELKNFATMPDQLKKVVVETDYWQNIYLFY